MKQSLLQEKYPVSK